MTETQSTQRVGVAFPRAVSTGLVVLGDLVVLLLFTAVGIYTHGGYAWRMPMYTLETFAPFLVAWVLVAPLARVYHRRTLRSYRRTAVALGLAWIAVSVLGGAIRATDYFLGGAPPDFILVNILFGLLFLLPWRLAAVWTVRRRG